MFAGAALALQQYGDVIGGYLLGQGLHLGGSGADGDDVGKGVPGAVGLADAAQGLAAAGLHRLQLLPGLIGVFQEGDHAHPADKGPLVINGVHVDEVKVLDLLPGQMEDRLARLQYVGQPGSGTELPQAAALDRADLAPGFLPEEILIGLVAKDDIAVGVDDGDALPHGVKDSSGLSIQFHGDPSLLCLDYTLAIPPGKEGNRPKTKEKGHPNGCPFHGGRYRT